MKYSIKKISGDASFREFYRVKNKSGTSIIVLAKKEKFKNLLVYAAVNKILVKNNISAPKLVNYYYQDNMIEISDLGDRDFKNFVANKKNKVKEYKKLIDIIIKLQKIKVIKKLVYKNSTIKFQKYDLKNLHKESDLFFDWYLRFFYLGKNISKIKKSIRGELNFLYKKLFFKNNFLTHRDFHASNIICKKGKLGVIDSQDMIIGNPLYDVVSLVDDIRLIIPTQDQEKLIDYYHSKSRIKKYDKKKIKTDYDILSIQRNLKILGIFTRLFKRDGKPQYLRYIPNTWKMINKRLKNTIFNNLRKLIKKNLPIRKLKEI